MRTTLDLPDGVARRAKLAAVRRDISLKDLDVLLALAAECHSRHRSVRQWWESQPHDHRMYVCRPVQTGLLRLMCSEAALGEDAVTLPDAWAVYATLLASGRFAFVLEPQGIDPLWEQFCRPFRKSSKVVADAYLAASQGRRLSPGYP